MKVNLNLSDDKTRHTVGLHFYSRSLQLWWESSRPASLPLRPEPFPSSAPSPPWPAPTFRNLPSLSSGVIWHGDDSMTWLLCTPLDVTAWCCRKKQQTAVKRAAPLSLRVASVDGAASPWCWWAAPPSPESHRRSRPRSRWLKPNSLTSRSLWQASIQDAWWWETKHNQKLLVSSGSVAKLRHRPTVRESVGCHVHSLRQTGVIILSWTGLTSGGALLLCWPVSSLAAFKTCIENRKNDTNEKHHFLVYSG